MRWPLVLIVALQAAVVVPANAVTIDWVYVGDPDNAPDTATNCYTANCGSVPYEYKISKYEVTNAQYAELLNAKAASDPFELYHSGMGEDASFGGITRSGVEGSYTYAVKEGFADKPVVYVSPFDMRRFANWLNNGQGSGDTETGTYTLAVGALAPRNSGANIFIPSENEWYKAAYYSPSGVYFDYPTGTNIVPGCALPAGDTGNTANCLPGGPFALTNVGAYSLSDSPYGTFDQGGNVYEWIQEVIATSFTVDNMYRGSGWSDGAIPTAAWEYSGDHFAHHTSSVGFRVASIVPEPATGLLVMTGLLGLAAGRTRRA